MRQWVVVKLLLRQIQIPRVWVFVALVSIELVERLLLVLLSPATIRSVDTSVDASSIGTNSCQVTTSLGNVHSSWVTHTVRLTSTIFWTEAIFHQLFVSLRRNLDSRAIRVGTVEAVNAWCWLVVVDVLLVVAITLEPGWILGDRQSRCETLGTVETEAI